MKKRKAKWTEYCFHLSKHDVDVIDRGGHIFGVLELTHYLDDIPMGLNVICPVALLRCHTGGSLFDNKNFRPIRAS